MSLTVLALSACSSTTQPSVTSPLVETPCQKPPAALLVPLDRPEAAESGTPDALLNHAITFGLYVQQLELRDKQWRQLFGDKDAITPPAN